MMRKAVGFYWTLTVPWAGFVRLPQDIEEAARESRTIRYQREAIHRHAKSERFALIRERAFLEIQPDRGSELVLPELDALAAYCREQDATLLYVDFSVAQGWRSHLFMNQWMGVPGIQCEQVPAEPLSLDGAEFDPIDHFRDWRDRRKAWTAGKPEREARARQRAVELQADGPGLSAIATRLNEERLLSPTGRPWTEANLGKFLKGSGGRRGA